MLRFDHPDAGLLALCAQLRALQARWQCLWDATSDGGNMGTAADRRFDDFSDRTWPGYRAAPATDPVRCLLTLRATTLDGLRAKAAALKAIQDAAGYTTSCREDEGELMTSFLEDAAGRFAMPLGEAAQAEGSHAAAG